MKRIFAWIGILFLDLSRVEIYRCSYRRQASAANNRIYSPVFQHLEGMIPSHSAVGSTAAYEDDFGLSILGIVERRGGNGPS